MATNDFIEEGLTDDYDIYGSEGSPSALPGSPTIDSSGHLIIPPYGTKTYFPPSPQNVSVMDPDPNNTGSTTDFWTAFPITIDINGYLFYYGENTGINVRGPEGLSNVRFEDLTPEQIEQIRGAKGQDGLNGIDGADGRDGTDGLSAYELWLEQEGYLPEQHPIEEFFQYLAGIENALVREGNGQDSLIINDKQNLYNTATGDVSFAGGRSTQAEGDYSVALGEGTIASNDTETVLGKYNENKEDSIFEIGHGNALQRHNIFDIDTEGNVLAAGNITDGNNNILSNKVDKITGKGLSTYDFNSNYKTFIDEYTVDQVIISDSSNPVSSSAVYNEIQRVESLSGRPALSISTSNLDLNVGFINDITQSNLDTLYWTNDLKWNPVTKILKNNNISTSSFTNITSFGSAGLTASANDQIILGKYNDPNPNNLLEIGYGTLGSELNILELSKLGNLQVNGEISDGAGNLLSNKQDILSYDTTLVEHSDNLITSGSLYDVFTNIGIDPETGIDIPELTSLQNQITALTTRVATLEATVAALGNPRELPDDTYPANIYTYGVDKNQFYIQKIRPVEEEEEEEEENDGNNS